MLRIWVFFFLLAALLLTGAGIAADVPFVFDSNSSNIAGYTADQLKKISISSSDIAGVPFTSIPLEIDMYSVGMKVRTFLGAN